VSGTVRVEPAGIEINVGDGESIMAAAQRAGHYWPTVCRGLAQCNRCVLLVLNGEGLTPMSATELDGLRAVLWRTGDEPNERLACQVSVNGTAVVEKEGVRAASVSQTEPPLP
jgi:ferredoxin, 2Fe-2S